MEGIRGLCDKELVVVARGTGVKASKAALELFNRCAKVINFLYRTVPASERDDYHQEAYLVFAKALEKVKLEKTNENFRFPAFFYHYLQNRIRKFYSDNRNTPQIDVNNGSYFGEIGYNPFGESRSTAVVLNKVPDTSVFYTYTPDCANRSKNLEACQKKLLAQLNPLQRSIVKMKTDGKGLKEIAQMMNLTYGKVYFHFRRAKEVASKVFEVAYN